ncbi:MAG TPA: substrate-binding domain-containing protein [Actinocrinis sp.]|uniref:substrate-binding domain-containing protein n=1 Tax=Actinocrinis sp. TaxID=1920516 RepID=UPI002DDD2654|nr:substrate-binding domain-containing protein [Actinocrinis sp.]HEV3173766.1 substrate-binding domain-containing protein [Actinocrinis sp.]
MNRMKVLIIATATALTAVLASPGPAAAASYVPVNGAGSTWAENAINQWTGDVSQYGMEVNYAGTGSSDGRNQFKAGTVDFAASDIPYGESDDGIVDPPPSRGFAYMPVVAGGTAFMYHLDIGGRRVTNLRLSGDLITKIFTGNITQWDDPAIKAENPGLTMPSRQIIPVVRTDGSGSTAQLTMWMAQLYSNIWNPYCAKAGRVSNPCGSTSIFPVIPGSDFIGQSLDSGVTGYVAQSTSEGSITYTEYSYARQSGFPVVRLLNAAGYYNLPTAQNVAVALVQAKINQDSSNPAVYLTQDLSSVYTDPDPRTYPLSSYSYMVIPTSTASPFNTSKGNTLGAFAYYLLCQGQYPMDGLGYSPLPINLVKAGFQQILRIPGAQAQNINVAGCKNPTFSQNGTNTLVATAPYPHACDKAGPTQCAADGVTALPAGGPGGAGGSGGSGAGGAGVGASGSASAGASGPASANASQGTGAVNPDTGQGAGGGGANSSYNPNVVAGQVIVGATPTSPVGLILTVAAVLFLLGAVFGPVALARLNKRRAR